MEKNTNNGSAIELSEYETPFADTPAAGKELSEQQLENYTFSFLNETDNPFKTTFELPETGTAPSPVNEAVSELLAELNDPEFETTLYNLAAEAEDTFTSKISNESAMGQAYIPFASQQINQYMEPLALESERMIDRIREQFSGNDFADQNEAAVEQFFNQLEMESRDFSPAQEQFFGSLLNKIKSVVKTGDKFSKKRD